MHIPYTEKPLPSPKAAIVQFVREHPSERSEMIALKGPALGQVFHIGLRSVGTEKARGGNTVGGENLNSDKWASFMPTGGNQLNGALEFGIDLSNAPFTAQRAPQVFRPLSGAQHSFQGPQVFRPLSDPEDSFRAYEDTPLQGALAFGVDMSAPQVLAQTSRPQLGGEHIFQVNETDSAVTINNEGPIGSISPPAGWTKEVPNSPPPGTYTFHGQQPGYAFRVTDGQSFVPPDHALNPAVKIHVGHGLDPAEPQAEAALRQVLRSKPAIHGEQQLTAAEFTSVAAVIGAQDGGNNQFHDLGIHGPKFNVTGASTVDIHGRTALLVKGNFVNRDGTSGLARETIFIDSDQAPVGAVPARIEQVYVTAPPEKIQQYEKQFWDTIYGIKWAPHP